MQEIKLAEIERKLKDHPKIKNLREFLENFFNLYSAEFIILFGSSAKGKFNYRSDLDLLIVTNSLKEDYFDRLYQIQLITSGGIDFFLYTPTEFEIMITNYHLIAIESISTGIIIYDKGKGKKYKKYINNLLEKNKIQKLKQGWKINL